MSKPEEQKNRRDFLKYTVGGVVGVAVGAAATYGLAPPVVKEVPGPAVTQTQTAVQTVVQTAAPAVGWVPPPTRSGAKVTAAVTAFDTLTEDAFGAAIDAQLEFLGGKSKFEDLVKGKKVAMKTILHNPTPLEDPLGNIPYPLDDINKWKPPWPTKGAMPANVHPLFAKAMAKRINQAGAAEVAITEGVDAGGSMSFDGEVAGYKTLLADLPWLKWVELDHEKLHMVDVPKPLSFRQYAMPDVLDGKVVINLSQIKTHYGGPSSAQYTAAIKSWIGIQPAGWCGGCSGGQPPYTLNSRAQYDALTLPQKFYGDSKLDPNQPVCANIFQKSRQHGMCNNTWNELNTVSPDIVSSGVSSGGYLGAQTADLHSVVKGHLALADASSGTEGQGAHLTWPWYDPRSQLTVPDSRRMAHRVDLKYRTGHYWLIGSYDEVAVDTVVAQVMGWAPMTEIVFSAIAEIGGDFNNLLYAKRKNLGETDPRMIDVKGVDTIPNAHFMRVRLGSPQSYPLPINAQGRDFPPAIHPDFAK
jgi:hypothetical protein